MIPACNFLILELDNLTGRTTPIGNPYGAREVTPIPGGHLVTSEPPLMFPSTSDAQAWIEENGVEGCKYLVAEAKAAFEGGHSRATALYSRYCAAMDALMNRLGFVLDTDGVTTYEDACYALAGADAEIPTLPVQWVTRQSIDAVMARAEQIKSEARQMVAEE